jgi:hypothetical protein
LTPEYFFVEIIFGHNPRTIQKGQGRMDDIAMLDSAKYSEQDNTKITVKLKQNFRRYKGLGVDIGTEKRKALEALDRKLAKKFGLDAAS